MGRPHSGGRHHNNNNNNTNNNKGSPNHHTDINSPSACDDARHESLVTKVDLSPQPDTLRKKPIRRTSFLTPPELYFGPRRNLEGPREIHSRLNKEIFFFQSHFNTR